MECARCGDCCDPVTLSVSPADISAMREALMTRSGKRTSDPRTIGWMLELQPTGRFWLSGVMYYTYQCPEFDRETRQCGNYTRRPYVCTEYPWYGREPHSQQMMSPRCSFIGEVRNILPIVEVRSSHAVQQGDAEMQERLPTPTNGGGISTCAVCR